MEKVYAHPKFQIIIISHNWKCIRPMVLSEINNFCPIAEPCLFSVCIYVRDVYDSDNFLHLLTLPMYGWHASLCYITSESALHRWFIRMDNFGQIIELFFSSVYIQVTDVHDYVYSLHLVNSPMYGWHTSLGYVSKAPCLIIQNVSKWLLYTWETGCMEEFREAGVMLHMVFKLMLCFLHGLYICCKNIVQEKDLCSWRWQKGTTCGTRTTSADQLGVRIVVVHKNCLLYRVNVIYY